MPIYAYRCSDCGFQKDVLQKFSDAPLTVCPSCQKDAFGKQLTAPAFQLKGTGWYVTDFRDNGKQPAGKASSGAADSKTSGGDAASGASGDGAGSASAAPSGANASGSASTASSSSGTASSGSGAAASGTAA